MLEVLLLVTMASHKLVVYLAQETLHHHQQVLRPHKI